MKKIVVLNGIHGSGKSTLGRLIAQSRTDFSYFSEIGHILREEAGSNAMSSGLDFDREVMQRELSRDSQLMDCPKTPLIETWHIGNLAYVLSRSPSLYDEYLEHCKERLEVFDAVFVLVEIDWTTFTRRATENIGSNEMDKLLSFYQQVLDNTFCIYQILGISNIIRVPNEGKLEESMKHVTEKLSSRNSC